MSSVGRRISPASLFLATTSLGLVAGSAFLLAAAISVYQINQENSVTFKLGDWAWISDLRFRLDHIDATVEVAQRSVSPKEKVLARHDLTISRPVHRPYRKKSTLRKMNRPKLATVTIQKPDAGIEAPARQNPERDKMQEMNRLLRHQFLLGLNTQPELAKVLIAAAGLDHSFDVVRIVAAAPAPAVPSRSSKKKAIRIDHIKSIRQKTLPVPVKAVIASKKSMTTQPPKARSAPEVIPRSSIDAIAMAAAAVKRLSFNPQNAVAKIIPLKTQVHASAVSPHEYSKSKIVEVKPIPVPTKVEAPMPRSPPEKLAQVVGSQPKPKNPAPQYLAMNTVAMPTQAPNEYSIAPVQIRPAKITAAIQPPQIVNSQKPTPPPPSSPPDHSHLAALDLSRSRPKHSVPQLTEAFDWNTYVNGGSIQKFTHDIRQDGIQAPSWLKAEAADHWPTLALSNNDSIPVISANATRILSALTGTSLQNEAGIVFGRVPSGWGVRLSGRADRPIFLSPRNQTIPAQNLQGERYFAFLNAEPGAHLLFLTNGIGADEAAIGIAVIGGAATFADLSNTSKVEISGRVLDGSSSDILPLAKVTVRLLGRAAAEADTDNGGYFRIHGALAVSGYPMYFETDQADGYKHRYQILPDQLGSLTLYRLNAEAIQTWLGQLEGTISADSGLVIAALPNLTGGESGLSKLVPNITSLAPNPTLIPEIYTLSADGQLQVQTPLDQRSNRLLSIQVPEGPAVVSVSDGNNIVWSQLIMASPRVINLIGPL